MDTLKVYHGSKTKFDSFKLNSNESNFIYGTESFDNGLGIFFTDNKTMAEWFAGVKIYDLTEEKYTPTGKVGYVYETEIIVNKSVILSNSKNNYDDSVQEYFKLIEKAGGVKKLKQMLNSEGYDSIQLLNCDSQYYGDGTYNIYVVLNTSNTKILNVAEYGTKPKEIENKSIPFKFKKEKLTGRFKWVYKAEVQIFFKQWKCGSIFQLISNAYKLYPEEYENKYAINLMVKKERTEEDPAPFRQLMLKKKFDNEDEAKIFVNQIRDKIHRDFDLYYLEND